MSDIIENEEVDRDTVDQEELERLFSKKYNFVTETAVSLKQSYINKLSGSKSLNIAFSLEDNSIEVYQLNNTSLSRVCRLSGHKKTVTEVVFDPKSDNLLYSTSHDGVIKLWDTRSSGSCVQEYKDEEPRSYECMDVARSARVLCAGAALREADACLVFWDARRPAPLGGYWNSHEDDITQVKFHKEKSEILATGSLDGLLNIYNITEQSEDDALTYSLNVENSVEKISWLDEKRLACASQANDLQLWDADSGDLLKMYPRDKLARSIKRSRADDCYLVDTFMADDDVVVLAGSYGGDENVLRSVTVTEKKLQPTTNFSKNTQIVRCCWYDRDRDILVTAGESGLLSVWSSSSCNSNASGASKKVINSFKKLHVKRHKPY